MRNAIPGRIHRSDNFRGPNNGHVKKYPPKNNALGSWHQTCNLHCQWRSNAIDPVGLEVSVSGDGRLGDFEKNILINGKTVTLSLDVTETV